jgi:acetylornithine/N-succinyldiaminopimelate aminotransferase
MKTLVGDKIQSSEKVNSLIQQLTNEVGNLNKEISGVRPPQPEFTESGKALIQLTGAVRGRPLYYDYLGTGAGNGAYVELMDGSIKLDLINGIGIHILGHGHSKMIESGIRGSLCDIVNQGNLQPNREYQQIIQKLTQLAGKKSKLKYGWLSTCGTMANESALKIARQKTSPARMVLAFKNAFAGRSTMMAELTDNPAFKMGLPEYHEILRIPWYDYKDPQSGEKTLRAMKDLFEKHGKDICVFTFEPMLGEGGYMPAPREFFLPLLEFCRSQKVPNWFDEVQTFSRTGELFAFETLELGDYVDLCTIAKTAQIGATLYTEEMNPLPGLIAGTYSGASAALAAGLETLEILEHGNYLGPHGRIMDIHRKFTGMLKELSETTCKGKIADIAGLGVMIAFTPLDGSKETVDKLLKKMFQKGLMAFSCGKGPVRLRFLIPAVIKDEDLLVARKIIEESLIEGV